MKRVTREELPKLLREKRGECSQSEFANGLNVFQQTVAAWEAGDYLPKPSVLAALGIRIVYEVRT